jgi:hypothetical protein
LISGAFQSQTGIFNIIERRVHIPYPPLFKDHSTEVKKCKFSFEIDSAIILFAVLLYKRFNKT